MLLDKSGSDVLDQIINDKDLIERAKSGDPEAFGELVSRHRAKAYGWARKMTQDSYLAEDIVQEALLQAFLKISNLIDSEKFMSWFYTIVKNQGNMKLRRGGPNRGEHLFSTLHSDDDIDWSNIDQILFQLTKSIETKTVTNPVEQLIRKETIEGIALLLKCLTQQERQIFERFFFEQLKPKEIADLFNMKVSNIYNVISRSRQKLQRERVRIEIRDYIQEREIKGLPKRKMLDPQKII